MAEKPESLNFIERIIEDDLRNDYTNNQLRFRFPPEPNGYLHIGHASAICLNFGLGLKYNAPVNLRFDDTNPAKEEQEFVDAIKKDVEWLGFKWDKECYASDYFMQLYEWAIQLIKGGKAYVDKQNSELIAQQKGTVNTPGTNSPYRDTSVEENLQLFEAMKSGDVAEGQMVLRAKIDMASPNLLLRDPVLYRVLHKAHHRTGTNWKIFPMYDWAHGQADFIEQVSHSLCTLEFLPHRALYDWCLDQIVAPLEFRPKQREFARRNVSHTVVSKRKLLRLIEKQIVTGWDDPRMPTISGLRRRGFTPGAIRKFADSIGVGKRENVVDVSHLEFHVREELNKTATRVMVVQDPIKLVITNYPENKEETLEAINNPEDPATGTHKIPFSKELYIERDDFKEEANRKFFRLTLGKEVRLKNAYIIKGESVVKDAEGRITEVHCTYDPESKSGTGTEASMRKVKGTIHWVSIPTAKAIEVRLYDRLFTEATPDADKTKDFLSFVNPNSLNTIMAYAEPFTTEIPEATPLQFQRLGYYILDQDSTATDKVFNRTVSLRDSWAKIN